MSAIKSLNKWANAHTYYFLDLLRVALGVFLFLKGINFVSNTQILVDLIKPIQNLAGSVLIMHYVVPAHLIGGVLIAFGLLTRWSVMAQLPLLVGAVIINFIGDMNATNLVVAIFVTILSLFFLFYGSGKHSVDYYLKMQQ
ncbi:DoxX family protein [Aquimarina algicola]|uniref:DoxX family membrane protein n=1 Tax=Aquimarina algicola TaxID=2589995 RepID=A0A504JHI3_9FLAO|nr:DoxX family protein [Aquimarina algicola]TPN85920.1 DoxX family membrane protein [Aquimarina algicola]